MKRRKIYLWRDAQQPVHRLLLAWYCLLDSEECNAICGKATRAVHKTDLGINFRQTSVLIVNNIDLLLDVLGARIFKWEDRPQLIHKPGFMDLGVVVPLVDLQNQSSKLSE